MSDQQDRLAALPLSRDESSGMLHDLRVAGWSDEFIARVEATIEAAGVTAPPAEPREDVGFLRDEIARWIGKSGFAKEWDRCLSEADGLLEYLRERSFSLAEPRAEGLRETVLGVLHYSVDEREHAEQIADDIVTALATPPQQAVPDPVPQFDGIPPDNCSYPSPRAVPEAASPTLREAADLLWTIGTRRAKELSTELHALASQPTPAPLDVERLARALRAYDTGKPSPDGFDSDTYRREAERLARAYAQQDTPKQYGGASRNTAAPLTTFVKGDAQQDTPEPTPRGAP